MEGDNWAATTQLHERRITDRNRHYLSEFHWLYELYRDKRFTPCWIDTASNGPDIYTKGVSRQTLQKLRPLETGYLENPRPLPDITMTPTLFKEHGLAPRL